MNNATNDSIAQHPLASSKLGEFVSHKVVNAAPTGEPADWVCLFKYENGSVLMEVVQNKYHYHTQMKASHA